MTDFEVLVFRGAYPSSVAMSRDILDAAAQVAAKQGVAVPTWGMYSLDGGCLPLRDGISIKTRKLPPRRQGARSVCVIPGLGADPPALLAQMRTREGIVIARRLARHVVCGGQVAASCSAVFVLHAAGLLAGRRATTTWWLAPLLARESPECTVDADRMVCADGPVITAGAAFAHADLMLHLLRERFGPKLSESVSRLLLLEHSFGRVQMLLPGFQLFTALRIAFRLIGKCQSRRELLLSLIKLNVLSFEGDAAGGKFLFLVFQDRLLQRHFVFSRRPSCLYRVLGGQKLGTP